MPVNEVISVENLSDCIKENGGEEVVEGGNACKTKRLKALHSKPLIGCIFFSPKSVTMDARESGKKSGVQMHLYLTAKSKTPIDSWCLQMISGSR